MDNTKGLVEILGAVRKQMNGAVLDSWECYGTSSGVSYGVSIPALREIASKYYPDTPFARYLFSQQVREIKIIALWVFDPAQLSMEDVDFIKNGIINSELAEQAAQAIFSKSDKAFQLIKQWSEEDNTLLCYCSLMAWSRVLAVDEEDVFHAVVSALSRFEDNKLIAQACVNLALRLSARRDALYSIITSFKQTPTVKLFIEEFSWRKEYE